MTATRKPLTQALTQAHTGLTLLILQQTQARLESLKARLAAKK